LRRFGTQKTRGFCRPPLDQLADLLAELRAAERLPWPDLTVAMAEEQRYLAFARSAGAEGRGKGSLQPSWMRPSACSG
jgi:hypothetical protein